MHNNNDDDDGHEDEDEDEDEDDDLGHANALGKHRLRAVDLQTRHCHNHSCFQSHSHSVLN